MRAGSLLITGADLGDGRMADVRVVGDRVVAVGMLEQSGGDVVVDAARGALLPGLHDHHLHLFSLGASLRSVRCGPPEVLDEPALAAALRAAGRDVEPDGWVRGVAYHESVAGPLDRWVLDGWLREVPLRVQHRSGALWMLNSAAVARLELGDVDHPGVERTAAGEPTGQLWRMDRWLGDRVGRGGTDLAEVGRLLARHGITGVTDATPGLDRTTVDELVRATEDGRLPQRLYLLGAPHGTRPTGRMSVGPHKILLPDHDLPGLDQLVDEIRVAHAAGRGVAVHCVTRASLALTLAALDAAGDSLGDRIEHGAVLPPELAALAAAQGVAVVTQPVFLVDRGDDYLSDVDSDDRPHLYPYASLLAAGIPVGPSSDAPFGDVDPWRGVLAARDRQTPSGHTIGEDERVDAATALAGLLSPLDDPGGAPRRIEPGTDADLCLLHAPLAEALRHPSADQVRLTICHGKVVHGNL